MMMPMLFMLMARAGSQKAACDCKIAMTRPLTLKMTGVSIIKRTISTMSWRCSAGRSGKSR